MPEITENPIKAFENDMEALVRSIEQYTPDPSISSSLLKDSDKIGTQIKEYRARVESHAGLDTSQEKRDKQLSTSLFEMLHTLVDCKRDLDNLPKLDDYSEISTIEEKDTTPNPDPQDAKAILSYALKLSKFSKIPRTFDGSLLPNNFIWPGDDNMRRGNLAMASLIPEKLIQFENYGPDYVPPSMDVEMKDDNETEITEKETKKIGEDHDEDDDDEEEDDFLPERTNSIENINKNESTAIMAGLDLLDSDDE